MKTSDSVHLWLQKFVGERWVDELGDQWKKETIEFQEATHNVTLQLLRAFAIAQGLEEDHYAKVTAADPSAQPAASKNLLVLELRIRKHLMSLYCRPGMQHMTHKPTKNCTDALIIRARSVGPWSAKFHRECACLGVARVNLESCSYHDEFVPPRFIPSTMRRTHPSWPPTTTLL